jgi:DNA topoisomerase-3
VSFAHLPVIPPYFDLKPVDKTKSRLNAVVKQAKRKDVTEPINACDAGREGELIFRLIEQYAMAASLGNLSSACGCSPRRPGHPRRLDRRCAASSRWRPGQAARSRLKPTGCGHQRYARHDGVQPARRRFLDHRLGADATLSLVVSAKKDPASSSAATTGNPRHLGPGAGEYPPSGSTLGGRKAKTWRPAPTACGLPPVQAIANARRGKQATVTEESKPTTQASPCCSI